MYVFSKIALSMLFLTLVVGCSQKETMAHKPNHLTMRLNKPAINDVMVVAHRACWHKAPENSLAAIEACINLGVDMVEIDVRLTRDGKLVVIHDTTVDRTTDGFGQVSEMTFQELRTLYLRNNDGGKNKAVTAERIPTLEEVLKITKDRILVNIDAKTDVRAQALTIAKQIGVISQTIIKINANSPDDPAIINADFLDRSLFMPIVKELKDGPSLSKIVRDYDEISPVAYEVIFANTEFLQEGAEEILRQGNRFWVNTMKEKLAPGYSDEIAVKNPDAHWGELIRLGVNIFQTDRPEELLAYLNEHDHRLRK